MNKPKPEDFGLSDSQSIDCEHKANEFYLKIRNRKSSESHIVLFWITLFCGAIGLNNENYIFVMMAAVSGAIFIIIVVRKLISNPHAKPDLPLNYIAYKESVRNYESFVAKNRIQEELIEKEKQLELKKERQRTYEYWSTIDPYQFEHEVAILFKKHGFIVEVTKGSGDQGIDIKLLKGGRRGIVQCKRFKSKVSPSTARDLYGAMTHGNYDFGFIVCPSSFSKSTFEFTKTKPITLIGLERIVKMSENSDVPFL